MKNTFGNSILVTLFGESHGDAIGAVVDGLAPGLDIDMEFINHQLSLRKPKGKIGTKRHEEDNIKIISGVFNGKTTGTPLSIIIQNNDTKSDNYDNLKELARPGHADYTGDIKYHGFQDYRGGGHFSGRLTAPLVAVGAILILALQKKGIKIGTHIKRCGGLSDRNFINYENDINLLNNLDFAVLDDEKSKQMTEKIEETAKDGDSIGGILETAIIGIPGGLGEPWFDSFESLLSHGIFSIPAVKGIWFGDSLDLIDSYGSEFNDSFQIENGNVITKTNHNGGINGGITNGMPVVFHTLIKPTPSIYKMQDTINFKNFENCKLQIEGRHDPAIIHRARVVVDSIASMVVADLLAERFGTDFLSSK